jgi:chromatin segregation and condensation protein Rec8/ScpA/Scc1 (kleisin family)
MDEASLAAMIQEHAQAAVHDARDVAHLELDYSEASLQTVELILEKYHCELPRGRFMRLLKRGPSEGEIEQMTLQNLFEAYMEVLARIPDAQPERMEVIEIQRETFTLKDRRRYILNMLSKMRTLTFFSLFSDTRSKLEVAVTFLALLDLIHKSIVTIQQPRCFEDITITKISEEAAG